MSALLALLPLLEQIVPVLIKIFVQKFDKQAQMLANFQKWAADLKTKQAQSETLKQSYDQQKQDLEKNPIQAPVVETIAAVMTTPSIQPSKAMASELPIITREQQYRDFLVAQCLKDVGQKESNGNNRSPMIDDINKQMGEDMGQPYCISGLMIRAIKPLGETFGLKRPFMLNSSTQSFWQLVPAKYKRLAGIMAKKGDMGILQNRDNADRGHAFLVKEDQVDSKIENTVEYNTDPSGGRDGDGVYERTRSQDGDDAKKYLGCIDIVQWFLDENPIEISKDPSVIVLPSDVKSTVQTLVDWNDWCKKAIDVSKNFEGGDWSNITGNFDGAYLTCGALGFTWKYNNQPPMILQFLAKYGAELGKKLMPQYWEIYLKAANLGENGGASIVSAWTSNGANVKSDVKKELQAFWSSPEMIQIQITTAWRMMGDFAQKKCLEAQSYFGLAAPQFAHFSYWFDQAVLNGQGSTVQYGEESTVDMNAVLKWCKSASGYEIKSLTKCADLWATQLLKASPDQVVLWKMAYLRAMKSRPEFKPVTMCRRGTLALGTGMVNGSIQTYDWKK